MTYNFTSDELDHIQQLRNSVAEFKAMISTLPPERRSIEHNQQFNELRSEAQTLLNGPFTEKVPRAITGDLNRDRSLSAIVVAGVILALIGLGINSIILEDVLVNSLGCCVSSGGMLLILGAFGILVMKNVRERVNTIGDLKHRCKLLLHQLDHRLAMTGRTTERAPSSAPSVGGSSLPPNLAPPEAD